MTTYDVPRAGAAGWVWIGGGAEVGVADGQTGLRLRILGRHGPTDGLAVEVVDSGALRVWHDDAAPDRIGPLQHGDDVGWLGPWVDGVTAWDVVVAHRDGVDDAVAIELVRRIGVAVAALSGTGGVDPEAVWLDRTGEVLHVVRVPGAGAAEGLPQLARYLVRGELAHAPSEADPAWLTELEAMPSATAVRGGLAALEGDPLALEAAIELVDGDPVGPDPRAGRVWYLGGVPAQTPAKVEVARIAALTLVLGALGGWFVASNRQPPEVVLVVPGAEALVLTCPDGEVRTSDPRIVRALGATRCTLVAEVDGSRHVGTVDTSRAGTYECSLLGGDVTCEGP